MQQQLKHDIAVSALLSTSFTGAIYERAGAPDTVTTAIKDSGNA